MEGPSIADAPGTTGRRRRRLSGLGLRVLRALVLVAAAGLVHWQHRRAVSIRESPAIRVDDVQVVMPGAVRLGGPRLRDAGRPILDAGGREIGGAVQTSPESDPIVGYAGPTNTLLVFDASGRLSGFRLLASDDTIEHVHRVMADRGFAAALIGRRAADLASPELAARVDAVSGATLTSTAILRGIQTRLGSGDGAPGASALFVDRVPLGAVRRLFPDASAAEPHEAEDGTFTVRDAGGAVLGTAVRTSPEADALIGYQGPTEALVGITPDDAIVGFTLLGSFDTAEYVDTLSDEPFFMETFDGRPLGEVAGIDVQEAGIEGVSGATLTSWAVAQGIADRLERFRRGRAARDRPWLRDVAVHEWGTLAVLALALVAAFSPLRGRHGFRLVFQAVLVGYLGLTAGNLLAIGLVVGWSRSGVPWTLAPGLALLAVAAVVVPWATGRNVYCHHLCPHGAAQQLVTRFSPWRNRPVPIPSRLERVLRIIPGLSLLAIFAIALSGIAFPFAAIEPFNAYVFRIAGTATIVLALLGLLASLWIPLPYCKFGCPTGALIGFARTRGSADRFSRRDAVALAALAVGLVACWLQRGTAPN